MGTFPATPVFICVHPWFQIRRLAVQKLFEQNAEFNFLNLLENLNGLCVAGFGRFLAGIHHGERIPVTAGEQPLLERSGVYIF